MNKNLAEKINKFLEIRNISNNDDYSTCSKKDLEDLYEIFCDIIDAKFDKNCYGDYPVSLSIIPRITHEPLSYIPIRYIHKAKSEDEINDIIEMAGINVSIASDKLNQLLRVRKLELERIKASTRQVNNPDYKLRTQIIDHVVEKNS